MKLNNWKINPLRNKMLNYIYKYVRKECRIRLCKLKKKVSPIFSGGYFQLWVLKSSSEVADWPFVLGYLHVYFKTEEPMSLNFSLILWVYNERSENDFPLKHRYMLHVSVYKFFSWYIIQIAVLWKKKTTVHFIKQSIT